MQMTCKFELHKINQLVINNAFKVRHFSFEVNTQLLYIDLHVN